MPFDFEQFRKLALEQNHSKQYLDEALAYASKLDQQNLPVVFDRGHLAALLGLPWHIFEKLLNSYNYTHFNLVKRSGGGFREIMAPNEKLKYVQRWINYNILQKLVLSDACTGFKPGSSILKNASIHADSDAIFKVDLLRFFDTIIDRRVYGVFKSLGYHENVAYDLAKLCVTKHRKAYWTFIKENNYAELEFLYNDNPAVLPQGAPTSPMLANIIASRLDDRFTKLSKLLDFRYSRYADDLTFSIVEGGRFPDLAVIKKIISDEGFFINNSKVKYFKAGMKQYVTGISVTHGTTISKKERKEIFKQLYYCQKFGPLNHIRHNTNERSNRYGFQDWLLGKIAFIYSIDKKNGIKMLQEFEKINWTFEDTQNVQNK